MGTDRDRELAQLIKEQAADDNSRQRPVRYSADGKPVMSLQALDMTNVSTDLDGVTVSAPGRSDLDPATGPGLVGRFRQREVRGIAAPRSAESPQARIVREAIEKCTPEQQETFRLVFGEGLSLREAAQRLGIHFTSVRDRVETLKRLIAQALIDAAEGGDR